MFSIHYLKCNATQNLFLLIRQKETNYINALYLCKALQNHYIQNLELSSELMWDVKSKSAIDCLERAVQRNFAILWDEIYGSQIILRTLWKKLLWCFVNWIIVLILYINFIILKVKCTRTIFKQLYLLSLQYTVKIFENIFWLCKIKLIA